MKMLSAANGLLSNISNLSVSLLDGPPPPYGALQLPMGSFTCTGPCICSLLRGCGPKGIHGKENKDERREYTHFSWHTHRLLKAMWFPLKHNWMTLLEGHYGRWHKKGALHLKQVLVIFFVVPVRIFCALESMQFAKKYINKRNKFNSLKSSCWGLLRNLYFKIICKLS